MANGELQMANEKKKMNPVQEKSYEFAVTIVKFCRKIMKEQHEYDIPRQLLRSGTSVGANIEEAQQAQSRRDFHAKMCIALKEAYESRYWLKLMRDALDVSSDDLKNLFQLIDEIIRLLVVITKSTKSEI